jgi:hypothetical protein
MMSAIPAGALTGTTGATTLGAAAGAGGTTGASGWGSPEAGNKPSNPNKTATLRLADSTISVFIVFLFSYWFGVGLESPSTLAISRLAKLI